MPHIDIDKVVALPFPRDRYGYMYRVKETDENKHQAKLELRTLKWAIQRYTKPGDRILDPMSGTGSALIGCFMGRHVVCLELERHYHELQFQNYTHMETMWREGRFYDTPLAEYQDWDYKVRKPAPHVLLCGDARTYLPLPNMDAVIFSPPYGELWRKPAKVNKVTEEKRYHVGYSDNPDNVGNLKLKESFEAMKVIYQGCFDSLKPGGVICTVVKDYVRNKERVWCSKGHANILEDIGFEPFEWHHRLTNIDNSPFSAGQRKKKIEEGTYDIYTDIKAEDLIVYRRPV